MRAGLGLHGAPCGAEGGDPPLQQAAQRPVRLLHVRPPDDTQLHAQPPRPLSPCPQSPTDPDPRRRRRHHRPRPAPSSQASQAPVLCAPKQRTGPSVQDTPAAATGHRTRSCKRLARHQGGAVAALHQHHSLSRHRFLRQQRSPGSAPHQAAAFLWEPCNCKLQLTNSPRPASSPGSLAAHQGASV